MKKLLIIALLGLVQNQALAQESNPFTPDDVFGLFCEAPQNMRPEVQQIFVTSGEIQEQRTSAQGFFTDAKGVLELSKLQYAQTEQQIIASILEQVGEEAIKEQALAVMETEVGKDFTPEQAFQYVMAQTVASVKQQNQIPATVDSVLLSTTQASCGLVINFEKELTEKGCKSLSGQVLDIKATMAFCSDVKLEVSSFNENNQKITQIMEEVQKQILALQTAAQQKVAPLVSQLGELETTMLDKILNFLSFVETTEVVDVEVVTVK